MERQVYIQLDMLAKKRLWSRYEKINEELKFKDDKTCKFICALSLCWPDGFNITIQKLKYTVKFFDTNWQSWIWI